MSSRALPRRPAVWLVGVFIAAGIAAGPAWSAPAPAAPDGYHSFSEVERQLKAWDARPEVEVSTIGRSAGGRALYVARLASPGGVDPDRRPAVFVGAGAAGFHNAGTEAALHLIETLLAGEGEAGRLLRERTFYVAPVLNPDAHDGMFGKVRQRRSGNDGKIDRDRDGLVGEDGPDDLDGDGRITWLRIPDPTGAWMAHPDEPRLLIKADPAKGQAGAYRREAEGRDDDRDGAFNEDGPEGVAMDRNFPHAFPYPEAGAGPWPSSAPEAKAVLDFLLARRNLAVAVVYGPANNLLAAPQSLGGGDADLGTLRFKVPQEAAEFIGLDPDQEYTLDEVWEVVKDLPFARQNNLTKEQVAQFLGTGPATKVEAEDQGVFDGLATAYKERLTKAGLAVDRPAAQYGQGGLTPWLYYQAGALALELDVWGIPKAAAPAGDKAGEAEEPLTAERLAAMTSEQFLALGEEKIAAFLAENKVPAQFGAKQVMAAVQGGQLDPPKMAQMIREMGGGAPAGGAAKAGGGEREREVLAWLDANAPGSVAPWTAVTLPDGTRAEVGGLDPFAELAPSRAILAPALTAHTATVLDLAGKIARLEILDLTAADLGGGVWRVKAVAGNKGELPTHTKMAERARAHLPVRLVLADGGDVHLVTGQPVQVAERLAPGGTLASEWLVRAPRGARIAVEALSDHAGTAARSLTLGTGKETR